MFDDLFIKQQYSLQSICTRQFQLGIKMALLLYIFNLLASSGEEKVITFLSSFIFVFSITALQYFESRFRQEISAGLIELIILSGNPVFLVVAFVPMFEVVALSGFLLLMSFIFSLLVGINVMYLTLLVFLFSSAIAYISFFTTYLIKNNPDFDVLSVLLFFPLFIPAMFLFLDSLSWLSQGLIPYGQMALLLAFDLGLFLVIPGFITILISKGVVRG